MPRTFLKHCSSACWSAGRNGPEIAATSCPLVVSKEKERKEKKDNAIQWREPSQVNRLYILMFLEVNVVRQVRTSELYASVSARLLYKISKIWPIPFFSSSFFPSLNCIWALLLWVYLSIHLASARQLLRSSPPLSCALEHSSVGAGMDANESFGSTNAQLTAGCYISFRIGRLLLFRCRTIHARCPVPRRSLYGKRRNHTSLLYHVNASISSSS